MFPGETIATGFPQVCDECDVDVLERLAVMRSGGGHYIGTSCDCGTAFSRESGYYPDRMTADIVLESCQYARGGDVTLSEGLFPLSQYIFLTENTEIGYVGKCLEVPGLLVPPGETEAEGFAEVRKSLNLHLAELRSAGKKVPKPRLLK